MVGDSNLSSLNISNNNLLQVLSISISNITSLDISQKINLIELYAANTALNTLDISNNPELVRCYTTGNTGNLTCIKVNQTQLDNIPSGFSKDENVIYSTDCL